LKGTQLTIDQPAIEQPDTVDDILEDWGRERPELDVTSIGVFGRLTRVVAKQRAIHTARYEKYGLTWASFDVLANLRRSGGPHGKTAGELAKSSMLTTGGITFRLDRMEEQSLIERVRTREDRRLVYARLTEHGKDMVDFVFDQHVQAQSEMLARLSTAEIDQLAMLLKKVELSITEYQQRQIDGPESE